MSISAEDLRQAFLAHRRDNGQTATLRIIKRVTGADGVQDVPAEDREKLLRALETGPEERDASELINPDGTLNTLAIMAKWNAAGRRRS